MICWFSPISGIASTGTGSFGRIPVFQSKGAVTKPHTTSPTSRRMVTNLLYKKYLMVFENISDLQEKQSVNDLEPTELPLFMEQKKNRSGYNSPENLQMLRSDKENLVQQLNVRDQKRG